MVMFGRQLANSDGLGHCLDGCATPYTIVSDVMFADLHGPAVTCTLDEA